MWRGVVGALLAVVVSAQLALAGVIVYVRDGVDFGKLYYGWHQSDPYAPTPASGPTRAEGASWYRNLNPPHVFLLAWPFSPLPIPLAVTLWLLLQAACGWQIVRWSVRPGSGSGSPDRR